MNKPKKKPLVAIVIALNDLEQFHGGSRNGIKDEIGYFDQFLILYESIKTNWQRRYFDYDFYLLHSLDFSDQKQAILNGLDINVMKVSYWQHETKIRPMCYSVPIDCDFRLVLDVDMYAMSEPNFNFSKDALAVYGGNKYTKEQWQSICGYLGAEMPKQRILNQEAGTYKSWRFTEHFLYQTGKFRKRKFPYFNNGAILIRNGVSQQFVQLWEQYRTKYSAYVKKQFDIDIDLEGQDVVGLAIANTTSNWSHFPKGFNLVIQERFDIGKKLVHVFKGTLSLLHYIQMTNKNKHYALIKDMHGRVRQKYYSQ